MASDAKRKKDSFFGLRNAIETVCSVTFDDMEGRVEKLSEREIQCWLVGKYGIKAINQFCDILKCLPPGESLIRTLHAVKKLVLCRYHH